MRFIKWKWKGKERGEKKEGEADSDFLASHGNDAVGVSKSISPTLLRSAFSNHDYDHKMSKMIMMFKDSPFSFRLR
jgi:hypothetical protein